jgi:hypothetical protein
LILNFEEKNNLAGMGIKKYSEPGFLIIKIIK